MPEIVLGKWGWIKGNEQSSLVQWLQSYALESLLQWNIQHQDRWSKMWKQAVFPVLLGRSQGWPSGICALSTRTEHDRHGFGNQHWRDFPLHSQRQFMASRTLLQLFIEAGTQHLADYLYKHHPMDSWVGTGYQRLRINLIKRTGGCLNGILHLFVLNHS